jgi:sRNA-binding regulator protein Hfq
MSNRDAPPSKPRGSSGISPTDPRDVIRRLEVLEKFVKEYFDEKNQWNSLVREWIGTSVRIRLVDGEWVDGVLRWVDRYTLCCEDTKTGQPAIIHKAAIAVLTQDVAH